MKKRRLTLAATGLVAAMSASTALATVPNLAISLGLRETEGQGTTPVPFSAIGANGGSAGGIEFVDLDAQMLPMDGNWYKFSWTLSTAQYTAFAGATANGVLNGSFGVLEHLRIRNIDGWAYDIELGIDNVTNTIGGPVFPPPTDVVFGDFEGQALGSKHIFQNAGFSGSTASNVLNAAATTAAVVDDPVFAGNQAYGAPWRFVDSLNTRWVRLTTFPGAGLATGQNPQVRFDQNSVISVWLRAVPEPTSLALLGFGGLVALRRRR